VRRAGLILVLAVVGLGTAVAVAWGLVWAVRIPMYPRQRFGSAVLWNRGWNWAMVRRFGAVNVWWGDFGADAPGGVPRAQVAAYQEESSARAAKEPAFVVNNVPPSWGTFGRGEAPRSEHVRVVLGSDTAYGWPMPCLWHQIVSDYKAGSIVAEELHGGWGIEDGGLFGARSPGLRVLPLRPIWAGLAVDTALYAVMWGLVVVGVGAARRGHRRRHGKCLRCGYDRSGLAGAVCPECGQAAPGVGGH
jgi:hypothetical protein